jgi:hypothetical protein
MNKAKILGKPKGYHGFQFVKEEKKMSINNVRLEKLSQTAYNP